jgi:hypothetical protein
LKDGSSVVLLLCLEAGGVRVILSPDPLLLIKIDSLVSRVILLSVNPNLIYIEIIGTTGIIDIKVAVNISSFSREGLTRITI